MLSKELALKAFKTDDDKVVEVDSKANKIVVNLSKNKKFKNLTYMSNIRATGKPSFLIPNAKKTFNHLWLAFIKALILQHFDPKSYIRIETNASSYTIGGV